MRIARGTGSWIFWGFILIIISGVLLVLVENPVQMIVFFIFILSVLIEGFFLSFFRDPDRRIGDGIVAVADGVIREISNIADEDVGESVCISTFMNIYHVHVNRMPVEGIIDKIIHIPGGHIPAFKKESDRNERVITLVQTKMGTVKIIQIAGTLARRIVSYNSTGQHLKKGKRLGIIRLGSRVDLIIPKKNMKHIMVKKGDGVRAGETQICRVQ